MTNEQLIKGSTAYRLDTMTTDPVVFANTKWGQYRYRLLRLDILWAMLENAAFNRLEAFSQSLKQEHGIYLPARQVYNPTSRLYAFWQGHLMGGPLDPDAGDGISRPSALPIVTPDDAVQDIRPAIASIWKWSMWATQKDRLSFYGPLFGDVFIRVIDDPEKEQVKLRVVNPANVAMVDEDAEGNVKEYTIAEVREDPDDANKLVQYREEATRDGDTVIFKTFKAGVPFGWDGDDKVMEADYGFTPLVHIQHRDVGLGWGWPEAHETFTKLLEVDDIASIIDDYVRKLANAPWFLAGVRAPKSKPETKGRDATEDTPLPGREEVPVIYADERGSATPLVSSADLSAMTAQVMTLLENIAEDHPEISQKIWEVGDAVSGRAIRIKRQPVVKRVKDRRVRYYDGTKRATQMALTIGGLGGYGDGAFSGIDKNSFEEGALDFEVGETPVFEPDALDILEEERIFWETAQVAKEGGQPIEAFLRAHGWSEERILEVSAEATRQAAAERRARLRAEINIDREGAQARIGESAAQTEPPVEPPVEEPVGDDDEPIT